MSVNTIKQLKIFRDINAQVAYGINFSNSRYKVNLAAASSASLAVPAGANACFIQIQGGASVAVSDVATPTPASGSFTACNDELNPSGRSLHGVSTLYFYAYDAALIYVSFYKTE